MQDKKHIRMEMQVEEPSRQVQRVAVRELLAMKHDVDAAATAGSSTPRTRNASSAVGSTASGGRRGEEEVRKGRGTEKGERAAERVIQPVWSDAAAEVAVLDAGQQEVVSCHLLPTGGHVVVTRDLQAGRLVVNAGKAEVLVLNQDVDGVSVDVSSSLILAHSRSMQCIQAYRANQAFTQVGWLMCVVW